METIGGRLSYLRSKVFGMSQKDFSELILTSQGALSEMENDKRGIPMESLVKLAEYSKPDSDFGCIWLLTGHQQEPSVVAKDEAELLDNYRRLDDRGRHKLHAFIYDELDRIQHIQQQPSIPFAASGWADMPPEAEGVVQQHLQQFEQRNRELHDDAAAKDEAVWELLKKDLTTKEP